MGESSRTALASHEALAVVLQVRDGTLQVLLWQRAREPFNGAWALPGGLLGTSETLEASIRRHLAAKVDVRELAHLEQLETRSDPARHPGRVIATAYLGLVPSHHDPAVPADTAWHPADALPKLAFDHHAIVLAGRERLRAKLSYTNVGFALAPPRFTISELRTVYRAALGHDVSATNLQRVLLRRGVLEPTGESRAPGRAGGRPGALFRFHSQHLEVTDQFAVLRPPRFTISELRTVYRAALGHDVSATNLQRVLLRRGVLEPTGESRAPGQAGGRPAALFRFHSQHLEVTDQFAVLRPPR